MNAPTLAPARWEAKHELFPVDNVTGLPKFIRIPVLFTSPDTTRVGIGTNTPLAKLDLRGALRLGTLTNNIAWQFREENITYVGPCMIFENVNPNTSLSKNLVFRTTGNIGIGTDIPESKLDVDGNLIIRGKINAKSISLSGNINANSLSLRDGITAADLSLSNNLTTNNLTVTGNFSAINLSLTGNINATSLSLTDGITASNLSLSNNLTTNNLSVTGNFSASNVNFSGNITGNSINGTNLYIAGTSIFNQDLSVKGILKIGNSISLGSQTISGADQISTSSGQLDFLSTKIFNTGNIILGPQKFIKSERQSDGLIFNVIGVNGGNNDIEIGELTSKPTNVIIYTPIDANQGVRITNSKVNSKAIAFFRNDGYVGIGTTTPNAPLHITGFGDQYIDINSQSGTGNSYTRLMAVSSNNITESQLQFKGRFSFVEPLSGVTKMIIDENGNVGIGTTAPAKQLHIKGPSPSIFLDDAAIQSGTSEETQFTITADNGAGRLISNQSVSVFINGDNNENNNFFSVINNSSFFGDSAITLFNVNENGNVGIGTPDPAAKLEVNSGGADLNPIVAISTPTAADFISIFGGRQNNQNPFISWKRGHLRFATANDFGGDGFSEKMRITENGNVGIGTTNPQAKL